MVTPYHKLISLQFFLCVTLATVQYQGMPSFIQASNLFCDLASYTEVAQLSGESRTFTVTFAPSLSQTPLIMYGIDQFMFTNSQVIEYKITIQNVSTVSFNIKVAIRNNTYCLKMTLRFLAIRPYTNITAGVYSNQSVECSSWTGSGTCVEYFDLNMKEANILISLTALFLNNPPIANPAIGQNSYFLDSSVDSSAASDRLLLSVAFNSRIFNFSYSYLAIGTSAKRMKHFTITFQVQNFNNGDTISLATQFDPSQVVGDQTKFVGLMGFKMDYNSNLYFESDYLGYKNSTFFTLSLNPGATAKMIVLILGGAFCTNPKLYITLRNPADCWTCPPKICSKCKGELCGGCVSNIKYLNITNLETGGGNCLCNPGYIQNGDVCYPCLAPCLYCENTTSTCTKCRTGYIFLHGKCVTACYITNISLGKDGLFCNNCSKGCQVCTFDGICLRKTCPSNQYTYQNECLKSCKTSTFPQQGQCLNCRANCLQCSSYGSCDKCADGYYIDDRDGQCQLCDPSCKTCHGSDNLSCTQCNTGRLAQGVCIDFIPEYLLHKQCLVGQYNHYGQCLACSQNCLSCTQISYCYQCNKTFFRADGICSSCQSLPGFQIIGEECIQVCGDGIKKYAQCDDGNIIDGDGCSSNCTLQQGYLCDLTSPENKGDICSLIHIPKPVVVIERSFARNSLRFTLKSKANKTTPIKVYCNNSFANTIELNPINQTILDDSVLFFLDFDQDFQNKTCNLTVTSRTPVNITVSVRTEPPSYFIPNRTILRINVFTVIMHATMLISMIVVLISHFLLPSLTSTFVCNISLYVVSYFNRGNIPVMALNILPAFREIVLVLGWQYEVNEYSPIGSLGLDTAEIWQAWPFMAFFLIESTIALIFVALKKKLSKTVKSILRTPIRNTRRFIHCTFIMYEPLILSMVLLSLKNLTQLKIWDFVYIVAYFIFSGLMVHSLYNQTCGDRKMFVASDGPSVRVQIYLYTVPVVWTYPKKEFYGAFSAILFMFALFCSRTYFRFKEWQFRKRNEQLKSQSNMDLYKLSKMKFIKTREKLQIAQQFFNDLFFIINNFLILFLSFSNNPSFTESLIATGINLANLIIFTLINLLLIVWGSFVKLNLAFKRRKNNTIHPEIVQIDQAIRNSHWTQNQIRSSLSLIKNKSLIKRRNHLEQSKATRVSVSTSHNIIDEPKSHANINLMQESHTKRRLKQQKRAEKSQLQINSHPQKKSKA